MKRLVVNYFSNRKRANLSVIITSSFAKEVPLQVRVFLIVCLTIIYSTVKGHSDPMLRRSIHEGHM